MNISKKNNLILLTASFLLLIFYFTIFERFLPNESGRLGHDHSWFMPALLDGYFWYKTNGLWKVPWFTPSFCGGTLNYLRTYSGFYNFLQFFSFFFDPLCAVRIIFLMFAGFGFLGFFVLLRRAFVISQSVSFFGAGLFLFNGFYTYRMLIGHLGFHSFMLLPFTAFFLLRPLPEKGRIRYWQLIFDCVIGGILFAYMVESGLSTLLIPVIISIIITGLVHGLMYGRERDFWCRLAGSGLMGILLSLSKLTGLFYFMGNFPRNLYKLPGAKSIFDATGLVLRSLFVSPAVDSGRIEVLTNVQWFLGRHEWEYSVTFIPMLLIIYGGWDSFRQMKNRNFSMKILWSRWLPLSAIAAFLILPIALNFYSPGWNAFLKQIPLIKNSSSLIRWFIIYIPVVILLAAIVLEKMMISKYKLVIVVVSMVALVAINAVTDRDFYHRQGYDPNEIIMAYQELKAGQWAPEIKHIGVYVDEKGQASMPGFRNNMLVKGISQLLCYEPLFGYRLEAFPIKTLHLGSVLEDTQGILNIKNPACYVWPEANDCKPGDHFTADQMEDALNFVGYRPFHFQIPTLQRAANWVNGLTWIAVLFFLNSWIIRQVMAIGKTLKRSGQESKKR